MKFVIATLMMLVWAKVQGNEMADAPPDAIRNKNYNNFIRTDVIHAGCYVTICRCGTEKTSSGFTSDIHDQSCDLDRVNEAAKLVHDCTVDKPKNPCHDIVQNRWKNLFDPMFNAINHYKLDDKKCSFYLATCYGLLLKDAVRLYTHTNKKMSYLEDKKSGNFGSQ